jgi:hypothetical protein
MQHLDFTSQLARERQARYRDEAGRNRLTRADRNGDGRMSRSEPDPHRADRADEAITAVAYVAAARLVGAGGLEPPTPCL